MTKSLNVCVCDISILAKSKKWIDIVLNMLVIYEGDTEHPEWMRDLDTVNSLLVFVSIAGRVCLSIWLFLSNDLKPYSSISNMKLLATHTMWWLLIYLLK